MVNGKRVSPVPWRKAPGAALTRGPIVYCLEQIDNGPDIILHRRSAMKIQSDKKLGAPVIIAKGQRRKSADWDHQLYRPVKSDYKSVTIRAVPYRMWGNRGAGDMLVWIGDGK